MQVTFHFNGAIGRSVILALFLIMAGGAGCDNNNSAQQAAPSAHAVSFVTMAPRSVELTTELSGRTSAFRIAEIRPRVSGLILRRLFTEGSDVQAEQVLYQIDPAPFQAELENAMAALARTEAQLPAIRGRAERYQQLLKAGFLSQQDFDDADSESKRLQSEITALRAEVKLARINLGYTKVIAPISGRIGRSSVTDGAIVTAYQATPLATIQQLDPIYVDVPRSTVELLDLKRRWKKGLLNPEETDKDKVDLIQEDGSPYPLTGKLQFQDVTVDPTTGSVLLRLIFPNPEGDLLPGMFVTAVIKEGVSEQALLLPQHGVSRDTKGNPYALIVDKENKVGYRPLTLDRALGDQWLVSSGLKSGDRVIVEGLQMLRPGMEVKATPYRPTDGEAEQTTDNSGQSSEGPAGGQ
jgi:membrane fusion protein (multidrug efflux system)